MQQLFQLEQPSLGYATYAAPWHALLQRQVGGFKAKSPTC
jgi:hypothetical protein